MYDVLIIGCGIVGASMAYELTKYNVSVCVCERSNDVANGVTKANSAILHSGFDCPVGSLEAKYNIRGIKLAKEICEKLDIERIQMPTFVVAFDDREIKEAEKLYERGVENGVTGIKMLKPEEALEIEPALNAKMVAALYAPESAIVNPWEYAIAMAETAVKNGACVKLESKVEKIDKIDDKFVVVTSSGTYEARYVINAAGAFSADVYKLVGGTELEQTNFCGQYHVLDKSQGDLLNSIVFPCPDENGFKGVLVAPTVHGNLIVGPDAYVVEDGDDVGTVSPLLDELKEQGHKTVPSIDFRESIHQFAGVRPNTQIPDFVIGESKACKNFINLAGIKSPGLSSAPAIAEEGINILRECGLFLTKKDFYVDHRIRIKFRKLNIEEKEKLIKENSSYGNIVCRCETITEGEIVEAIHRPIVPRTIDAIKRRCNAGLGRCQGGFCEPRVRKILARELEVSPLDILMDEPGTYILTSKIKEGK
jgi:glycerol-3-phosphate dehydrogenase